MKYTPTQRQRLAELLLTGALDDPTFPDAGARDRQFEQLQRQLALDNQARLLAVRGSRRPVLRRLEARLVDALTEAGFVEVVTPLLLGKGSLRKMGLDGDHPLWRQVSWVDAERCLRPMLAPNLYHLLGHLQRVWPLPVRIFEVGSCFRKESKGAAHLGEFTMLNLVELGVEGPVMIRLEELARLVMEAAELPFMLVERVSEVYGASVDIEAAGVEVASGVAGPHPLDANWQIADAWAGWGFGLERMVMVAEGSGHIGRFGRSLAYLDGARLNVPGGKAPAQP